MSDNRISGINTFLILTISIGFIILCIALNISIFFGFLGGVVCTLIILKLGGYSISKLFRIMKEGLQEGKLLFLLILLIGATVSVWLSSGIVPTMIYYGFEYMEGINYLFAAFVITSIIAYFMGTAVGTVSTVGLALIGIGRGFGVPEHVVLGSIISGAFIADKISPISGLLNLTLTTTGVSYKNAFRSMLKTLIPAYLITLAGYYFIGNSYRVDANNSQVEAYKSAILEQYIISPLLIVIPVAVLILLMVGIKTLKAISLGLLAGIITSVFVQNMTLIEVIKSIVWGFKLQDGTSTLNNILKSGGVASMVEVVLIVGGAFILNSLLENTGITKGIISKLVDRVKLKGELIIKTGMISSVLTVITCDQTVGIILLGRLLREKYNELGVEHEVLARTISDTGTIIAPLMPWNVNALIIGLVSSVSAINYAPYAILCYVAPVFTFALSLWINKSESKALSKSYKRYL